MRFRGHVKHPLGRQRPDDELPSPDDDLRLAVVDLPIAPVTELQFTTEGFERPFRGEIKKKVESCTDVVVSGVLDGRGDQHQHQRHDGGKPGEGGNLRDQLREET